LDAPLLLFETVGVAHLFVGQLVSFAIHPDAVEATESSESAGQSA
jgi:hypothetical protein